jgi:hypothetical protein
LRVRLSYLSARLNVFSMHDVSSLCEHAFTAFVVASTGLWFEPRRADGPDKARRLGIALQPNLKGNDMVLDSLHLISSLRWVETKQNKKKNEGNKERIVKMDRRTGNAHNSYRVRAKRLSAQTGKK